MKRLQAVKGSIVVSLGAALLMAGGEVARADTVKSYSPRVDECRDNGAVALSFGSHTKARITDLCCDRDAAYVILWCFKCHAYNVGPIYRKAVDGCGAGSEETRPGYPEYMVDWIVACTNTDKRPGHDFPNSKSQDLCDFRRGINHPE